MPEPRTARAFIAFAAILCLAAGLRTAAALRTEIVARDAVTYLGLAADVGEGRFDRALASPYPPGFPAAVAAAVRALPGTVAPAAVSPAAPVSRASDRALRRATYERAGLAVCVAAGTLAIVPLFLVARRLFGESAALATAFAAALQPYFVRYSAEIVSESLYALALLTAVYLAFRSLEPESRRPILAAAGASVAAFAAFATRPEGLTLIAVAVPIALLSRGTPGRTRLARAFALVLPLAVLAAPLVLVASSGGAGLRLSGKKEILALASRPVESPALFAENLGRNALKSIEIGHPLLAVLAVFGVAAALRDRDGPGRRFLRLDLALAALSLALYSTVRVDKRFALILAYVAVAPFVGMGVLEAARRGARLVRRPHAERAFLAAIAAAFVASAVPMALARSRPADRAPPILACAGAIRGAPSPADAAAPAAIITPDSRIAYYADAVALVVDPPPHRDTPLRRLRKAADWLARRPDARFLVVERRTVAGRTHERLEEILGRRVGPPETFAAEAPPSDLLLYPILAPEPALPERSGT